MKKTLMAGLLAAALVPAALAAGLTVNGVDIPQARIDMIIKQVEAQGQQITPATRQAIVDQLVTAELLRQEAVKKGMDKSADYQAELQNMQTMALAQRYIADYQRANPVTDAQLKAEYDKLKAQIPVQKKLHVAHILVATEAEANAVLDSLKKGKPFADLARAKSTDPESKAKGGDLGWFDPVRGGFAPEFAQAASHLAKGQITAKPVKTQFGWHIIKLEDVRTEPPPAFDALKPQLAQRMMGQRIDKLVGELRAKAKVSQ
ncbi:peptidylprolyl isomerase [Paludibacterium paludis]|uniref:peptidylprolyl isomerase n=1 Tax=Paludibacterium paludis TaxID=1225769 RepID=A0A918P3V2_9NEIS|nr:peptidylprolyl isomerase [Paludibacterium paludis]GGY19287.1 peptidylprolyl isomerase [Paludibacterium paludis]